MDILLDNEVTSYDQLRSLYGSDLAVQVAKRRIIKLSDVLKVGTQEIADQIAKCLTSFHEGKEVLGLDPKIVAEAKAMASAIYIQA